MQIELHSQCTMSARQDPVPSDWQERRTWTIQPISRSHTAACHDF